MSNSPDNSSPPPVSGHVDQIRDIIFGGQMRDYEQRFKKLEERLTQQAAELSEDLQKRAEALAELGIKGFESLTVNLKAEKGERAEADKELTKELKELSKTIDRGLAQLTDQTERLHKETLKYIAEQVKALRDQSRAEREDLAARLDRDLAELEGSKPDRLALGDILAEMGARLKGETGNGK